MKTAAAKKLPPIDWEDTQTTQLRPDARMRVMHAAVGELCRRGVEATSVQHILESSGVARRTFYRYFSDKTAVLNALLERSLDHMLKTCRAAMFEGVSGQARIQAGFDVYLAFASQSPRLILILSAESQRHDSPLMATRLKHLQQLEDLYREVYEEAEGKPLDALFTRSLILLVESVTLHVLAEDKGVNPDLGRADRVLSIYLERMLSD